MLYYRCREGHVFRMSMATRLLSLHLGSSRLGRCPVDRKWTRITMVSANDLTEAELQAAEKGRG